MMDRKIEVIVTLTRLRTGDPGISGSLVMFSCLLMIPFRQSSTDRAAHIAIWQWSAWDCEYMRKDLSSRGSRRPPSTNSLTFLRLISYSVQMHSPGDRTTTGVLEHIMQGQSSVRLQNSFSNTDRSYSRFWNRNEGQVNYDGIPKWTHAESIGLVRMLGRIFVMSREEGSEWKHANHLVEKN